MLPYITFPPIDLTAIGLGKVYWFAIFVVIGIVLGVTVFDRITLKGGDIDPPIARLMPEVCVIGGFVGAHLVHVLFYHPELMDDDPLILFKFWAGISSIGGFFGAAICGATYLLWKKQPLVPYGDRALFALTVGWIWGRFGCATSHDHPGAKTDFFLGVAFPDGVRHDLGLYEFLLTALVLMPLLMLLARKQWRTGTLLATVLVVYSPVRFIFDFLRAEDRSFVDSRYLGLTPAQYGVIILFAIGVAIFVLARVKNWPMQPPLWGKHSKKIEKKKKGKKG